MPRIVPSIVVAQIQAAFPRISEAPEVGRGFAGSVAGILALYDQVGEEHFALLTPQDYALLLAAAANVREMVLWWRAATGEGNPVIARVSALGERHPLEVLQTILGKCPDAAPSTMMPALSFLSDPPLAEVLRLDMSSTHTTLGNHEYKAASVMAGSVIEALLLWALKRKPSSDLQAALVSWAADHKAAGKGSPPPKVLPADWGEWKLAYLIEVGRRVGATPVLTPKTADVASAAKDFRNMIHPERADKTPPTRGTAQIAVGAMLRVAEELEALVAAGKL